jgi:hypothetical protein
MMFILLQHFAERSGTIIEVTRRRKNETYSLDMRQKSVNTYEAGNTSVRKVAERFQGAQKYGTGTTQAKKRDREITPLSGKRGETKPTLWSGRTDQRDGSRTARLHMLQNTVSIGRTKQE